MGADSQFDVVAYPNLQKDLENSDFELHPVQTIMDQSKLSGESVFTPFRISDTITNTSQKYGFQQDVGGAQ